MSADKGGAASEKPRRRGWRLIAKLFALVFVVLVLLSLALVMVGFIIYDHVTQPGVPGAIARVTVPEGATGMDIGRILVSEGYIEHERFFWLAIKLDATGKPIKHGAYALPHGLSPTELLRLMHQGPNVAPTAAEIPDDQKVTIPEGLTLGQIARMFPNPEAFTKAASDPMLIPRLGIKAPTLEGFLMPNTYFFDKKPTEREVVERALDQFEKTWTALLREIPEAAQRDKLEVVTIASLVEEETRAAEERPLVAAVIYNRLARNIPLSFDSTLQYALGKYAERMLDSDKQVDSPYNTYKNAGLPPGPISSPGLASLRAALRPAEADYLYFVSNADGLTHTFSRTLAEHERAVADFRAKIKVQRAEEQAQQQEDVSAAQ